MIRRAISVIVVLCAFSAAFAQMSQPLKVVKKAKFCRNLKCPAYAISDEVNDRSMKIESRWYMNSTQWVMTETEVGSSMTTWISRLWNNYESKLFNKLFRYIGGENEWGKKIDMTAPVLIRYEDEGNGRTKISMLFYVALDMVPRPTNPEVSLYTHPARSQVLVRSFNSWFVTFPWSWDENVKNLKNDVEKSYMQMPNRFPEVNRRVFYHVGYDGPFVFGSRHNEVWMEPPVASAGQDGTM